jgi:hypothetical protein
MAFQPLPPTTIGACIEGTADTSAPTTGVALPSGAQMLCTNLGSVTLYIKFGTSSGPDASSTTVGGGRLPLPAGSVQVFTLKPGHTHVYLYAASSCAYSIVGADGQ